MAKNTPSDTEYPMQSTCGAKTRSGEPCRSRPMKNGRCRMHGGGSGIGIGSPRYKTGRYSKDIPTRMAGRYEEARQDAELVQLGPDIALIDTRLGDILGQITEDSTGAIFAMLQKAWTKYTRASNPVEKESAFSDMGMLIEQGAEDWQKWQEVYSCLEQRRKMVESEAKRQVQLQQTLTASQAMVLLAAVIDTVKKHVSDEGALRSIAADIAGLSTVGAVGRA